MRPGGKDGASALMCNTAQSGVAHQPCATDQKTNARCRAFLQVGWQKGNLQLTNSRICSKLNSL